MNASSINGILSLFEVMIKSNLGLAQNYLEEIILNPDIWCYLKIEAQCEVIERALKNVEKLKAEKLIDSVLNAIEVYIQLDPIKLKEPIDKLWNFANKYLIKGVTKEYIDVLIGYGNIYYIRRLPHYPIQVLYIFQLLLNCYLARKDGLTNIIKHDAKPGNKNKILTTLLTTLDYFMYYLKTKEDTKEYFGSSEEGYSQKSDEVLIKYIRNDRKVIEKVVAMCVYLIIDFDWKCFEEITKDIIKTHSFLGEGIKLIKKGNVTKNENLSNYLLKFYIKQKDSTNECILNTIFSNKEREEPILGEVEFKAFMAVIFNNPQLIANELGLSSNEVITKKGEVVKQVKLISFVIDNIGTFFDPKTNDILTKTLFELPKESLLIISESEELLDRLFNQIEVVEESKVGKIYGSLMHNLNTKLRSHYWKVLTNRPLHKLSILNELLTIHLDHFNTSNVIVNAMNCLELAYLLEDISFSITPNKFFIETLAKLVLLLDEANALYMSIPIWSIFETRKVNKESEGQREGGFIRIVLKLIFLCLKNDVTEMSCYLLKYVIFREKEDKKQIVNDLKRVLSKSDNKASLYQILFECNTEAIKRLKENNDYYAKKVFDNKYSMLDKRKISKSTAALVKDNFFNNKVCIAMYIFSSLFQLIHFEVLKIQSYSDLSIKALDEYEEHKEENNKKLNNLTKLLQFVIMKDNTKLIEKAFIKDLPSFIKNIIDKHKEVFKGSLSMESIYSPLNSENKSIPYGSQPFHQAWIQFTENWGSFAQSFFSNIIQVPVYDVVINYLIKKDVFEVYQPILLSFVAHNFCSFDEYVSLKAKEEKKLVVVIKEREGDIRLGTKIHKQFANIALSRVKIERDELRSDFGFLAKSHLKKMLHEQRSILGSCFNKHHYQLQNSLFEYVKKEYKKLLSTCPLHKKLKAEGKLMNNCFNEFIKLSMNQDKLGRSMNIKRFKKIDRNSTIVYAYRYLKKGLLKKIIIGSMCKKDAVEYYKEVFKYELVRNLFKKRATMSIADNLSYKSSERKSSFGSESIEETSAEGRSRSQSIDWAAAPKEYIPRRMKPYEAELITIRGAIFGKLSINSVCISFQDAERKLDAKYRYGSTIFNRLYNERVNKKWKIQEISQMVVKRYNLIRQAIEIYFYNSGPVFFSLFSKDYLDRFLKNAKTIFKNNGHRNIEVIDDPEKYFQEKNYQEQWVKGQMSNFEYLMILNKYAGRSFNDLSQYPIFPWIISNYTNSSINLGDRKIYRPLELPIAAITAEKRKLAKEKLEILKEERETPYQFGSHYLPARIVLTYLLRLEPYASVLLKSENGYDSTQRMFHYMRDSWELALRDPDNNKELIPEFFYLPEIFGNFNYCSFGLKEITEDEHIKEFSIYLDTESTNRKKDSRGRCKSVIEEDQVKDEKTQDDILINKSNSFNDVKEKIDKERIRNKLKGLIDEEDINRKTQAPSIYSNDFSMKAEEIKEEQQTSKTSGAIRLEQENNIKKSKTRYVRVDQVILPAWAKCKHDFVRKNVMALESIYTSSEIDKWIDLVFGCAQQSDEHFNMFKTLCDENYVSEYKTKLSDSQLTEIQEFGVNPITLFKSKHQQRNTKAITTRNKYSIFNCAEQQFTLYKVHSSQKQPSIVYIGNYVKQILVIQDSQKALISKANTLQDRTIKFEKKEIPIYPFQPFTNDSLYQDTNCFSIIESSSLLFTCRHYDNSFKKINLAGEAKVETIRFHTSMVMCICSSGSKDVIFSGSKDGVIAMWTLRKGFSRPVWYNTNHNQSIVSIDCNEDLNLVITGGVDGYVVLRRISDGKFIRRIKPKTTNRITHVRLSYRGYLIIITEHKETTRIFSFTINGESLAEVNLQGTVKGFVMSETGYEFIVAGNALLKYDLLTLESHNLLENLSPELKKIKRELVGNRITVLSLVVKEVQELLLGTSKGEIYVYKASNK